MMGKLTLKEFLSSLADLPLSAPVKFAIGPNNEVEVASVYIVDGVIWVDLEPPYDD